ncbi:protein EMSY-LIKE 1-like [Silene latifolia]|uniref:protein EMSY-LIKE 1-like n=1 Tax=Silene latifolia TaxID=37657 RepID=UPI003D7894EB
MQRNMDYQIHHLEKEAYCSVLRALKAQSDAISWEKEGLITELRKELRVSDDEHRELLATVNNDDIIRRIREWRQAEAQRNASHPFNDVPRPTPPAARNTPRMSQPLPPHVAHVHPAPTAPAVASQGRNPRQFSYNNHMGHASHETPIPGSGDQLIGRKVLIRWSADNHFNEAVITNYNSSDGRHALVYGMNTPHQCSEWVNIMEIPSANIRWANEEHGSSRRVSPGENFTGAVPDTRRMNLQNAPRNIVRNMPDDIKLLHTDILIKQVEKVVSASNPDRLEIEKASKILKEHEKALLDAISKLSCIADADIW